MGWTGDVQQLAYTLKTFGADVDEHGAPIVRGNVTLFMGVGPDCVVDDEAEYFVDGSPRKIVAAMSATSYGINGIKVF